MYRRIVYILSVMGGSTISKVSIILISQEGFTNLLSATKRCCCWVTVSHSNQTGEPRHTVSQSVNRSPQSIKLGAALCVKNEIMRAACCLLTDRLPSVIIIIVLCCCYYKTKCSSSSIMTLAYRLKVPGAKSYSKMKSNCICQQDRCNDADPSIHGSAVFHSS